MKILLTKFNIYYEKLKVILLENEYFKKVYKQQQPKITLKFNNELLLQGIRNLYIKDLLLQQKTKILSDYEHQQNIQNILLANIDFRHSKEHRNIIRNLEILLDNLAKINDALTQIALTDDEIINEDIRKALDLNTINLILLTKPKRK
jgi:hypothetical protein